MKKFLSFISVFLVLGTMAFADVSVKKLSDGKVEVTFFYGNPRAQEVAIAGDFTNWQAGALPMTKGDKGWTYVTTVPAGTVMKYKFISDGNWTEDLKEPDKVDDGFGGFNGLVDVDAMVAAASPAAAGAAAPVAKSGLKFSMWSMLGYQTLFGDGTKDNKNEIQKTGVNLKSYLKVSGDALPGMPIYIEVALAEQDGFNNLYNKGTLALKDGAKNLLVDTVFDPIYFYDGQAAAATYLGHLKLGFNTPVVNFVTGYKYAKLPPHTNVNWITVDKEWEAGYSQIGGFAQYDFAPLFNKFLSDKGITADVVLGPNRTADRAGTQYGFYGYGNAKFNIGDFGQYVDFQYNGAYGSTFDTIFDEIYEADFILGYQGNFGPVTVKMNGLESKFGEQKTSTGKLPYTPSTSDVAVGFADVDFMKGAAANANVTFSNDAVSANVGYRFRGVQANMMYVEQGADGHTDISDQLGGKNTQRVFADVNVNIADKAVNVGVAPYFQMAFNADDTLPYAAKDSKEIYAKPYFSVDLKPLADVAGKFDGYAKLDYMTNKDDGFAVAGKTDKAQFKLTEAGVKYAMTLDNDIAKGFDVIYALDNGDTSYLFNTLLADVNFAYDITGQIGFGLRSKNDSSVTDPVTPFAFFVGAQKKLTVLAKPTAYLQYMYGMDPYKGFGDGPEAYNLDGYTVNDGVGDYNGQAAIRLGLHWDI